MFDDLVRFVRASYVETDDERMARMNKVCVGYIALVVINCLSVEAAVFNARFSCFEMSRETVA